MEEQIREIIEYYTKEGEMISQEDLVNMLREIQDERMYSGSSAETSGRSYKNEGDISGGSHQTLSKPEGGELSS